MYRAASEVNGKVSREEKWFQSHSNSLTDSSNAVPLLHFFLACASVVSYVVFVLSLYVPHLSFFWCLGKAILPGCVIFLISSLIFVHSDVSFLSRTDLQ